MKKFFISLLSLLFYLSCFAFAPTRGFIVLERYVSLVNRPIGFIPKTQPVIPFIAFQDVDEIVITSEGVFGDISVSIYNSIGVVVVTTATSVVDGDEVSIEIVNLPAGTYVLEITFEDFIYIGQFTL